MQACRYCWLFYLLTALSGGFLSLPTIHAQEAKATTKELRTWKAKDGGFSTEAALLEKKGDSVVLERKDGKVLTVPLDKLSFDDRVYVSEFVKKAAFGKPAEVPKQAPLETPATVSPAPNAAFDVAAIIKSWDQPHELLKPASLAKVQLERKPDLIEFYANGEFLYVVFYKEAKHLLYGGQDGKLLQTIEYGTAPLTAAAITPNGKHLVATLGDKGVGVYDIAAKKQVFVHPDIQQVNMLQTTPGKETFILGSQPSGEFYRYRLLHKFGAAFPRPPGAPAEFAADARTELISGADAGFLIVNWPFKRETFAVFEFDDEGQMKEYVNVTLPGEKRGPAGIGKRVSHYLADGKLFWNHMPSVKKGRFTARNFTGTATPQLFVAPDDRHSAAYEPDSGRLSVYHVVSGFGKGVQFHGKTKPEQVRLHFGSERLAAVSATGQVELFHLRGYRHRNEKILADVRACLASKQDERLEQLAAALEKDYAFFDEGVPADSKYDIVHSLLRNEGKLDYPPDGINPNWKGFQERNPDSRLVRYTRLLQLVDEAWEARGDGLADTVTPEGWRIFHQKLSEAEPIIESFAKEPTIPPVVYRKIFTVAMGQQWDAAKVKPFVERMLKECPENIEGHTDYAYSLLPRWGGGVDDAKNYAERIGREFPGALGESVYAAIAIALYNFHTYGVYTELHFDPERAQAGVKQLYRHHLDTPHYRQAELLLAVIARNGPEQLRWHTELIRHNDAWAEGVMKEKTFNEIMNQLAPKPVE